jgi:hypothetical protein
VRAAQPDADPLLVELCRLARGRGATAARAALLADATLPNPARATLALEIAARHERLATAQLVGFLAEEAAARAANAPPLPADDGLIPALLVLLLEDGGDAGLARGVAALGLDLPRARLDRLRDAARAVVRGLDGRRDLARVDALLHVAP